MKNKTTISPKLQARSVWISDTHLGFRGCQADYLLGFLKSIKTENLYLVGDIVDCWSLRKTFCWPQKHSNVIRQILSLARKGTKVIYIPGNHDEILREYAGYEFGNIEVHLDYVHETADGKQLLVMHGDEFDAIVKHSKIIAKLGSWAYDQLLRLNHYVNFVRRHFRFSYWSLAAYLKHKVKNAVNYIGSFESAISKVAAERGVDGVVCGHIHHAEISDVESVLYCNDGDWVESCSALIERKDGTLELIYWVEEVERHQELVAREKQQEPSKKAA